MRRTHTKEEHVKSDVKELFHKHDVWFFMPIGGAFATIGIPDFIACVDGQLWGIETKFGSNKPTALQSRQLEQIRQAGGRAFVITETNLAELDAALTEALSNVSHT